MNTKLIKLISSLPNWKANNGKILVDAINYMPGVLIKDLKYSDLMLPANQCNGVYVFQQGKTYRIMEEKENQASNNNNPIYWYVGKASGRALVDRIGAHFASRHDDYMNSLLKNIAWLLSGFTSQKDFFDSEDVKRKNNCIEKALDVIQDLYIKIISFDNPNNCKSDIAQAESILKKGLHPFLNDVNRKKRNIKLIP